MIVTRRIAVRIALIILATVIVQAAFFSQLSLFGAAPNVVPVVVVCLGLLGGGVVGAVCGFATGFLFDSLLLQTLGVSSLVLLSVGYLAGRYRESFEIKDASTPALLAGGFTLLATAGFAALQLMLGVESAVSLLVLREIIVQSLLAIRARFRDLSADPPRARAGADRLHAGPRARAPQAAAAAPSPPRAAPLSPREGSAADRRPRLATGSAAARRLAGARTSAEASPDGAGRRRLAPAGDARAAAAARGGARRARPGDVPGHLPPPLVPAGALRRRLPRRGAEQPGARVHRPGAARRDRGPRRRSRWSPTGPRSSCR